MAPIFHLSNHA